MKKNLLLSLLTALLLLPGCSKSPSQNLPPTLLWHKDQNLISPAGGTMNVWEGFRIDKDAFAAERNISEFILWRNREEKVPVIIEYSLLGGKINFKVNLKLKKTLTPSPALKSVKFNFRLSRGMNFLQFAKRSTDKLRIRSITIGTLAKEPLAHLRPGESFSLFHLAGQGAAGTARSRAGRDQGAAARQRRDAGKSNETEKRLAYRENIPCHRFFRSRPAHRIGPEGRLQYQLLQLCRKRCPSGGDTEGCV